MSRTNSHGKIRNGAAGYANVNPSNTNACVRYTEQAPEQYDFMTKPLVFESRTRLLPMIKRNNNNNRTTVSEMDGQRNALVMPKMNQSDRLHQNENQLQQRENQNWKHNNSKLKITAAPSTSTAAATAAAAKVAITTIPAPAVTQTTAAATQASQSLVSVENKCARTEPKAFSYQRAPEQCTAIIQAYQGESEYKSIATTRTSTTPNSSHNNNKIIIGDNNDVTRCEIPTWESRLRLAQHKAQLRYEFYKDIYQLKVPEWTTEVNYLQVKPQTSTLSLTSHTPTWQQNQEKHNNALEQVEQHQVEEEYFENTIVCVTQHYKPTAIFIAIEETDTIAESETNSTSKNSQLPFPSVRQLVTNYNAMIVKGQQTQTVVSDPSALVSTLKPASMANSDEGCTAGLSPCSSDNEDMSLCKARTVPHKAKVARCASSDSALGLDVDDAALDVAVVQAPIQRRQTLTVLDLPLRPALLPLAEPTALPDSPMTSPTTSVATVPSKVLLEERLVGIQQEGNGILTALTGLPPAGNAAIHGDSRRESTQSGTSELGGCVRYVRTPSVVVSDYSDDITACGISMEEMEYFRLQRARCQRRCSLDAGAGIGAAHMPSGSVLGMTSSGADGAEHTACGTASASTKCDHEVHSDVSAASSCSNLYYCGSTISALEGIVHVGLERKLSSQSSSAELSGDEEGLSELLAQTQLEDGETADQTHQTEAVGMAIKKVGSQMRQSSNSAGNNSDNNSWPSDVVDDVIIKENLN